jgi:ectoine hydroxylase
MPGLTPEQRQSWSEKGFFIVREALTPAEMAVLTEGVDRGYQRYLREHPAANPAVGAEVGTAIEYGDPFRELIDHPKTFDLMLDLLGPHIQLYISVFTVRPPNPNTRGFLHTDGGEAMQSVRVTEDSRPLQAKVHYFLTDVPSEFRGNFTVVPGSHRRVADWPEHYELTPDQVEGTHQIVIRAGDAVFFSHQLWHGAVRNESDVTRKTVTFGYSQLFMRPSDYAHPSEALLSACTPRQRRLLGDLGHLERPAEGTQYFDDAAFVAGRYYYSPLDQRELMTGSAEEPPKG